MNPSCSLRMPAPRGRTRPAIRPPPGVPWTAARILAVTVCLFPKTCCKSPVWFILTAAVILVKQFGDAAKCRMFHVDHIGLCVVAQNAPEKVDVVTTEKHAARRFREPEVATGTAVFQFDGLEHG